MYWNKCGRPSCAPSCQLLHAAQEVGLHSTGVHHAAQPSLVVLPFPPSRTWRATSRRARRTCRRCGATLHVCRCPLIPAPTATAPPAHLPTHPCPALDCLTSQVERAVEYMKEKGLVGAARDAADEVLVSVGDAHEELSGSAHGWGSLAPPLVAPALLLAVLPALHGLCSYRPPPSTSPPAQTRVGEAKAAVMAAPGALVHQVGRGLCRAGQALLRDGQRQQQHQGSVPPLCAVSSPLGSAPAHLPAHCPPTPPCPAGPAGAGSCGPAAGLWAHQLRGGGRQAAPGHGESSVAGREEAGQTWLTTSWLGRHMHGVQDPTMEHT